MGTQQIIWTALPNGLPRGSTTMLQLSVFVSPRLRFDGTQTIGTLDPFPDFHNWPAQLAPDRFSLDIVVQANDGEHAVPTTIVTKPVLDSTLWTALFGPTTFVRGYAMRTQREPLSSYPIDAMVESLYRGYGEVGQASPYARADPATLEHAFPHVHGAVAPSTEPLPIGRPGDLEETSDAQLVLLHHALSDALLRQDPALSFDAKLSAAIEVAGCRARRSGARDIVPLVPRTNDPASAFAQFAAFHRRTVAQRDAGRALVSASAPPRDPDANRMDFHQMLSALGEYPDLLRRLGLVIDLQVAADAIPDAPFGRIGRLCVKPRFTDPSVGGTPSSPSVRYVLDLRSTGSTLPFPLFAAAPRGADAAAQPAAAAHDLEIIGGLLNLNLPRPDPPHARQFDLVQIDIDGAVSKVLNVLDAMAIEAQRPQPIDRAAEVGAPAFRTSGLSLVRSAHGDDLIAGMRRAEEHQCALQKAEAVDLVAEDLVRGYRLDVRRFPADPEATPPRWLSLHRRVGTFTVRPPGAGARVLSPILDEGFIQPAIVQNLAPTPTAAAAVDPLYVAESWCHWTGWSLSAPPPQDPVGLTPHAHATPPDAPVGLPQLDVEFVAAPNTQPRLRFGHFYQLRVRTVDLAGNGLSLDDATDVVNALEAQSSPAPILYADPKAFRYRRFEPITAPELVLTRATTEGEFVDTLVIRSNGATAAAYAESLHDPRYAGVSERHIAPPKAALAMIERHGLLDAAFGPRGNPGAFYALCKRESGRLGTGQDGETPVHPEPQLRVPYLPDPIARGAAIFHLPGVTNTTGELDAQGVLQWSSSNHQVLAIQAHRQLGFVTKIPFGAREHWPDFLPFKLVLADLASNVPPVRPRWDPVARVLTVRLAPGETTTIYISAYPDATDVDLFGLHAWCRAQAAPSTDPKHFLNMAAHGALALISPPRKVTLVHAVQQPVTKPIPTTDNRLRAIRFENDTVAYIAGAFLIHASSTAKVDLFATWDESDEAGGTTPRTFSTHVFEVAIPPAVSPATSVGPVPIATLDDAQRLEFQSPPEGTISPARRYLARHEFGDTKHRKISYRLAATSRFREYFPERITRYPENLMSSRTTSVIVPSAARPTAPEVGTIVPAFGWTIDGEAPQIMQSVRRGGGLRVDLGPTWFSSGDGEQLAIVNAPGLNRWGLDPLQVSPSTASASAVKPDAPPARAPGSEYDGLIHPYDVQFDRERSIWYCDLVFRVGDAYFPFIELSLARYQPHSLYGLHVSSVVRAGIHQLAPDRTVTLAYAMTSPDHRRVTITVSALAFAPRTANTTMAIVDRSPMIEVTLEEREASHQQWDENLGWRRASAAQQPVMDQPPSQTRLWFGHVLLPTSVGGTQRRLVICEFEVFTLNTCPPGQAWIGDASGLSRRIVYADTIRVD